MHYFLGMEVTQIKGKIFIFQSKYTYDMLNKYGMDECQPLPTPIAHGKLLCRDDRITKVDVTLFRSLVGSLMFLTNTKPDIAHVVSFLSRYMSYPTEEHMKETERILR